MFYTPRRKVLQHLGAFGLGVVALAPIKLRAAVFLDIEQAQRLLLPNADRFSMQALTLDDAVLKAISKATEQRVPRNFAPQCWTAWQASKRIGWIMADHVVGKYDLIDYAVGFDVTGAVSGVEILAYRESHGAEIRQTAWRKQFVGRKGAAQIRFPDDIRNISGATLSSQHVTEGVQRLSALVDVLTTS